ncbi:LysR family transcriptional regulator [Nocardia sp. NPDC004340]
MTRPAGSISAAARNLNLTQPTLSRQLRDWSGASVPSCSSERAATCCRHTSVGSDRAQRPGGGHAASKSATPATES